ncbi:FkbM family methyltransferase [Brevibacillus choshinensis]|uniref:FkbM family methyltransferase n=1 Tax=Brevibacillus choshinensis TaxID=54911 RepID=A0ABX7FVH8_BRECH|nr:FkbM family methyltransferase [Brevibacillus choshinensis]QRG69336.1 FkbM family methyltransferase [Brevibacillus choshinensis]
MSRMKEIVKSWRSELKVPYALTDQETWDFWMHEMSTVQLKASTIQFYAKGRNVRHFIETGTFKGDMVHRMKPSFDKLTSIELDPKLYQAAKNRFASDAQITILQGDSGRVLPSMLESITEPCLFWLDGHYVPLSPESARGDVDTPILQELQAILRHPVDNHVILIDDARCFIGPNSFLKDYPTIAQLKEFVHQLRPDMSFHVMNDIIRICKPAEGAASSLKKVEFLLPFDEKSFTVYGSESDQSVLHFIETEKGYYEHYVLHPLKNIVQPDFICLDIGANIGTISLALSYLAREGKVYAFEPSDINYAYLVKNIAENQINNIEPLHLGVFDRNGTIHFHEDARGGGWSFIPQDTNMAARSNQHISCVRLDDWMDQNLIPRVDLIKLDVEGSEYTVLESALNTLRKWNPDLIIEFNPESIQDNFNRHPLVLYVLLEKLFSHIYILKRDDTIVKINNYNQLLDEMKPFHADLFCTNKTFLV